MEERRAQRRSNEGSRDRSLPAPRVTQNEKAAAVVADDRSKEPPKKPVTHRARHRMAARRARDEEVEDRPTKESLPYGTQTVFFGTDRNREKDRAKDDRQLASFGSDGSRHLTFGQAVVTVPLTGREKGEIPRPGLLSKEDATKHFTLFDVLVMAEKEFIGAVRRRLDESKTFKGQAFVFVHGYHVSFDDALHRTAQIAYDLGFDGVPFLFSWPSKDSIMGYKRDLDHALSARDHLRDFVDLIVHKTSVNEINLIAHSMGSWPLLDVLGQIAKDATAQRGIHINQIILAAPDIDRGNFEALSKIIRPLAKNFTVYASSKDWAMTFSGILALGEDRVGYVPSSGIPIILPGVETIDVSKVSLEFFRINHTEFAERWHILYDIGLILKNGTHPPDERLPVVYEKVEMPQGLFWRYRR
jgi:esterase/lipase superfamily enzyme